MFDAHRKVTAERLGAIDAQLFLGQLQKYFPECFRDIEVPVDAGGMVVWFGTREEPAEIQQLFYLVQDGLVGQRESTDHITEIQAGEKAAALLYFLAASRLVDTQLARQNALSPGGYVLSAPHSDSLICAVIVNAVFGGELHIRPPNPNDRTQPFRGEWVVDVPSISPNGDWCTQSFECAAFAAIFKHSRELSDLTSDSKGLTADQHGRLKARIGRIKHQKRSLALVVQGMSQPEIVQGLADLYQLPTFLSSLESASPVLRMHVSDLKGHIDEFLEMIHVSAQPHNPPGTPTSSSQSTTMTTVNINAPVASLALATDKNSLAQAGDGNTANQLNQQGNGLADLLPFLQELSKAIDELSSQKAREKLASDVETAKAQVAGKNPDGVNKALTTIKNAADALEGGEKIAELFVKASTWLGPLLASMLLP